MWRTTTEIDGRREHEGLVSACTLCLQCVYSECWCVLVYWFSMSLLLRTNTPCVHLLSLCRLVDTTFAPMLKSVRCRSLLDFRNKRMLFRQSLKKAKKHSSRRFGSLKVGVRRAHIFEDSYHQLRLHSAQEMRGKLNIAFRGEEGIDAGGVTREWYLKLSQQIFNPNYALFTQSAESTTFQPNPDSHVNPDHLLYLKFVGRFIGKAIVDGHLLDAYVGERRERQRDRETERKREREKERQRDSETERQNETETQKETVSNLQPNACLTPHRFAPSSHHCPPHCLLIALHRYFTRSFYKHMLGLPVRMADLEAIDPQYYKSLKQMLEIPMEVLCLEETFTATVHSFGVMSEVELKPGGKDIPVTDENKAEYVFILLNEHE